MTSLYILTNISKYVLITNPSRRLQLLTPDTLEQLFFLIFLLLNNNTKSLLVMGFEPSVFFRKCVVFMYLHTKRMG